MKADVYSASAWVLRGGVTLSGSVMALGLAVSLVRERPDVVTMTSRGFSADYFGILLGAARGDGLSLIELGILLLVLTPILRVASSAAIFAFVEKDRLYAAITSVVLALTLASLLLLR